MTVKPCINCWHKKGSHAWNPHYFPGGQWKSNATYPCQEEGCTCDDYFEATYEEIQERRRNIIWNRTFGNVKNDR